jgi:hypothetical protein
MAQRAGVALSCLANNAPFSITRVDGAPAAGTFSPSTQHNLDQSSVRDAMGTITRSVGFDTAPVDNDFAITFPIGVSEEQEKAFGGTNIYSHDHSMAFLNAYASSASDEDDVDGLFIDLTPGQVAAKLASGGVRDGKWYFKGTFVRPVVLGDVKDLSLQTVMDKLVTPVAPNYMQLYCVGILRPESAFPNISSSDLEARFPDTPVKWVSLDNLSHGAALFMHRQIIASNDDWDCAEFTYLPLGLALANGQRVTVVPGEHLLPMERKVVLSTSKDNQTSVTLRFVIGTLPWGEVVLEGLSPKPKGEARIKLAISCDRNGGTSVTAEEVGSAVNKVQRLKNILNHSLEDAKAYEADTSNQQLEQTLGPDGVIGELPE